MMIDVVFSKVFTDVMPYLSPLVFIVTAFVVADQLIDLIRNALGAGGKKTRRTG